MVDLVIPVSSLGIVDSVNPVTIAVALFLASTADARARLLGFVAGVFAVYLLGGLALLFAAGGLLAEASLPDANAVSLVAGVAMVAAAAWLWLRRRRWSGARLPDRALRPGLAVALGAAVTAIDLPTAFPYFGAIAALASSGTTVPAQIVLLVLFNALYVLPLACLLAARTLLGERCEARLRGPRETLERKAPVLVAGATVGAGLVLIARGLVG